MSGYMLIVFILAATATALAAVMSLLGIIELKRGAKSRWWTYKRALRVWVAAIALWVVSGAVRGAVDHQWVEAAVVLAASLLMAWVVYPSKAGRTND